MRIAMFDKMHLRICRAVEWSVGIEFVVAIYADNVSATALHALKQQEILCDVLVNQIEGKQRVPQVVKHTHKYDEIEFSSQARYVPHGHAAKFHIDILYLGRKSCLLEIVLIRIDPDHLCRTTTLHLEAIETGIAPYVQHALSREVGWYRVAKAREFHFWVIAEEVIRCRLYAAKTQVMKPRTECSDIFLQRLVFRYELS
jgi:hypothetical protein